ncbi:hypothetical protein KMZ29_14065 [Bradyrhizobium sediminis]|uniref:Uncharacterized protein n=1 Tax=Bradyrhizobium sediminis TaxID=2840469 RepID=A0A975N9D3_9BRAD|nr:hypothetical protein [Bradyrhizobium sediminis]QWG10912.1 hypothetical protein KMZ29_14065 [Bradyrhizobium sediminis]
MARGIGGLKINRQFELQCRTASINPFTLLIHVWNLRGFDLGMHGWKGYPWL